MTPRPGTRAPDATFLRPDGSPLPLASLAGAPLLLIFLRHLG